MAPAPQTLPSTLVGKAEILAADLTRSMKSYDDTSEADSSSSWGKASWEEPSDLRAGWDSDGLRQEGRADRGKRGSQHRGSGAQVVSGVASSPSLLDLQVVRELSLETQAKADS